MNDVIVLEKLELIRTSAEGMCRDQMWFVLSAADSCDRTSPHGGAVHSPMNHRTTTRVSLTALLGTAVTDAQGQVRGRLKDVAVATGAEAGQVAGLVLKTRDGLWIVPSQDVRETPAGTLELRSPEMLIPLQDQGNYLYLAQDLVDRQIIDIHGRKVVRVNDVDLEWMGDGAKHLLRVAEVEVGLRGAFRRVFKGLLPRASLEVFRAGSRSAGFRGSLWM